MALPLFWRGPCPTRARVATCAHCESPRMESDEQSLADHQEDPDQPLSPLPQPPSPLPHLLRPHHPLHEPSH